MKKFVVIVVGIFLLIVCVNMCDGSGGSYDYDTESEYEYPVVVDSEGEFDEEVIKTLTNYEFERALSEYEAGSEEAKQLTAIWEGYNIGLGRPINDATDLLTAWDNVTSLSEAYHLIELSEIFGENAKHGENLLAFIKKSLLEDMSNDEITEDSISRITSAMQHVSNESILAEGEKLKNTINEYLTAKTAASESLLTSSERELVEESQYFDLYISSRVRNLNYVEVGGYGVNDEYLDKYTCFINGDERIIVTFIEPPAYQGNYSGYFRYTGEDKYSSSDGFERNLANYTEVSAELVGRYYEDSENRSNAQTNLSNAEAQLKRALE